MTRLCMVELWYYYAIFGVCILLDVTLFDLAIEPSALVPSLLSLDILQL